MPFGGKYQLTPTQVMAATMPALNGQCETASVMAFGFDPYFDRAEPVSRRFFRGDRVRGQAGRSGL